MKPGKKASINQSLFYHIARQFTYIEKYKKYCTIADYLKVDVQIMGWKRVKVYMGVCIRGLIGTMDG